MGIIESLIWFLVSLVAVIAALAIGYRFNPTRKSKEKENETEFSSIHILEASRSTSLTLPSSPSSSGIPDYASSFFAVRKDDSKKTIGYLVAAASQRGISHRENDLSRQDNFCTFLKGSKAIVVLSDGVSSATEAELGSTFLVQNFERIFDEVFPLGVTNKVSDWRELNSKLSQNLVAMFVSRSKREKRAVPDSVVQIRVEAAKRFAATLEVLVCSPSETFDRLDYLFVRLAGDGKLFVLDDAIHQLLFEDESSGSPKNASVHALPIFDGNPNILQGSLERGQSLAFTTDGIGDFLALSPKWSEQLVGLAQIGKIQEADLLGFLNFPDLNVRDDRTIAIVTLPYE